MTARDHSENDRSRTAGDAALDRRGFLEGSAAAAAAVTISGFASDALAARAGWGPQAFWPSRNLRVGVPAEALRRPWGGLLVGPVLECLTLCDADNAVQPWLAEAWESSEDLTLWEMTLRPGARWHDGTPLTAGDVAANLNHLRDAGGPASALLNALAPSGAEARDARRLRLQLSRPLRALPEYLSHPALAVRHSTAIGAEGPQAARVGSGAYRLVEWREGDACRLRAIGGRRSALDFAAAGGGAVSALRDGRLDVVEDADPRWSDDLRERPGLALTELESSSSLVFRFAADRPEMSDPRLRQALALATNRPALLDEALAGHGRPGTRHGISPTQADFGASVERAIDHEMATLLLRGTAVARQGGQLSLGLPPDAPAWAGAGAAAWTDQLAGIGLTLEPALPGHSQITAEIWPHQPLGAMALAIAFRGSDAAPPHGGLLAALETAEGAANQALLGDAMAQVQDQVLQDVPFVQAFFRQRLRIARDDLDVTLAAHPAGLILPSGRAERRALR